MPNSKGRRRRFGSVRRLFSGRYQARYAGPDGVMRPAEDTFDNKTEAEVWLTRKEAEILEDDWIDPDAGEVLLADYGATWIDERPGLRSKTVTLYRYLLRSHIAPYFPATGPRSASPRASPSVLARGWHATRGRPREPS